VIVLGELFAGFRGGAREQENHRQLDEFLRRAPVRTLEVTRATAEVFGALKQQLKAGGTPIPTNDVWIAAHSVEVGAWLVTYDRHFLPVHGLLLWDALTRS
jgi:tRNA(fMet)-specific endonuclease VapC